MRILTHRPSPGTAFGLAALVIAIGGAAFAAIPDSSGVIHGCYDRRGTLRVIDNEANPPQACRSGETPLTWNQQGPPGTSSGVQTFYDEVASEECTSSTTYTDLTTPGPTVQPNVPANAIVLLQFSVDMKTVSADAQVALFEPTDFTPPLFLDSVPASESGGAHVNRPGKFNSWTVIQATEGTRDYKLVYNVDPNGPSGTACFKNRRLWISIFPVTGS